MSIDRKDQAVVPAGITQSLEHANGRQRICSKTAVLGGYWQTLYAAFAALLPGFAVEAIMPVRVDQIVREMLAREALDGIQEFSLFI